jgi:hypothetical protein
MWELYQDYLCGLYPPVGGERTLRKVVNCIDSLGGNVATVLVVTVPTVGFVNVLTGVWVMYPPALWGL